MLGAGVQKPNFLCTAGFQYLPLQQINEISNEQGITIKQYPSNIVLFSLIVSSTFFFWGGNEDSVNTSPMYIYI